VFVPTADPFILLYWALHRLRHFVPNNKRRIDKIRFGKINPVIRFYTVFFPYDQNIIPQTINSQIMRHRQRFDHGESFGNYSKFPVRLLLLVLKL
jgi:hypothetical protein